MEWSTCRHLDLSITSTALITGGQVQAQCAAFHPTQAILAVAVGPHIIEFDALTGCQLSSVDIGAAVVRLAYSPAGGHVILAVLEDWTIRSWDLETEHTCVLYSPIEKKGERLAGGVSVEVHIALTHLRPWLFFSAHRRSSVNVVGTREGSKLAQKVKTDYKKPVTDLACHPRAPLLFVAHGDGTIRGLDFQTFGVKFVLQDPAAKLAGAGAIAFHSSQELLFVGDRSGVLLAWDITVQGRPQLLGSLQVGATPVSSVAYHSTLQLVITLTRGGAVRAWHIRTINNPNRPVMRANFFEPSSLAVMDVADVLTQQAGPAVYPVPRPIEVVLHPSLNLATVVFAPASGSSGPNAPRRTNNLSREARRQLLTVLQGVRAAPQGKGDSTAATIQVLKEKLAVLGSTGILTDHQALQQALVTRDPNKLLQSTPADHARKSFLYGNPREQYSLSGPVPVLPLLCITDTDNPIKDVPVCETFQEDVSFFALDQGQFTFPARAYFMDACSLWAYSLASGDYTCLRKLSPIAASGVERIPVHLYHSDKQGASLIVFECRGGPGEVVLVRGGAGGGNPTSSSGLSTLNGRDAAFLGREDSQYLVLHEGGERATLHDLERERLSAGEVIAEDGQTVQLTAEEREFIAREAHASTGAGPTTQALRFETRVLRVFSAPLEGTVLYAAQGHVGLAQLPLGGSLAPGAELVVPTGAGAGKVVKLRPLERVLQVKWQGTGTGPVAGVLTTQRVMIVSATMEVVASTSAHLDSSLPPFRSCAWVGPSLLFCSATAIAVLGWDSLVRPVCTIDHPNTALIGALNDRLLMAVRSDGASPGGGSASALGVQVRTRLVGLLEPLAVGYVTMHAVWDPALDLTETMYQLTSRFDSLRITPRMVDALTRGPSACADLGVELAMASPQFTPELRCWYAMRARRFTTALTILRDEFLRSKDYPRCPPTSRLFQRFRELGRTCIKYGQFDRAKETLEVVGDYESLLDLYVAHMNPSAMRQLAAKLRETNADPELLRQVERVLTLRSASWSQGGAFTALAGDNMAPKAPSWGGGNWDLKVIPKEDRAPEWELSSDVTAYMRTTQNQPIPTIIPDALGVYLGREKGRGAALPTGEKFAAAAAAAAAASGAPVALSSDPIAGLRSPRRPSFGKGSSFSTGRGDEFVLSGFTPSAGPRPSEDGEAASPSPQVVSRASSVTRRASTPGAGAAAGEDEGDADEQARAAEAFRRGFSIVDESSSDDEDNGARPKKLQIRIRDKSAAGPARESVDVGKLKEATRAFKLGEGGKPGPGGKLTFGGGSASPSAPSSPVAHSTGGQPGGPIPLSLDFGLPGGGVPPQSHGSMSMGSPSPLSLPSPLAAGPASIGGASDLDFGLPGGGVPPQAPSRPPDLGIFEVTAVDSGVPPRGLERGPATGPPSASASLPVRLTVEPGQVPRGGSATECFKTGLVHLEQNQLGDALACFNEVFVSMRKDMGAGKDIKAQAKMASQYKQAVLLLEEIGRLNKVAETQPGAKDEMARLSRHLSGLQLQAKHRILCMRTAVKRNMDVHNYGFSKKILDILAAKAPPNKQGEFRNLINVCVQRGLVDNAIDGPEDVTKFCAATLGRLPTIGHDTCDMCSANFSTGVVSCTICGLGSLQRSDARGQAIASPFG